MKLAKKSEWNITKEILNYTGILAKNWAELSLFYTHESWSANDIATGWFFLIRLEQTDNNKQHRSYKSAIKNQLSWMPQLSLIFENEPAVVVSQQTSYITTQGAKHWNNKTVCSLLQKLNT